MHFLNISTSKSVPRMVCFHILTCKRAPRHCRVHYSTNQLAKVLRNCGAFQVLTSKCAGPQQHALVLHLNFQNTMKDHNFLTSKSASLRSGVQFLICYSAKWLRTCRSSQPTFRPSRAPKDWKHKVFCDFSALSRAL